jgi:RND family efflux transporter MFP subunit
MRTDAYSLLSVAALAGAMTVLASCSSPSQGAKPTREEVVRVAATPVVRQDLAEELELSAEFRPYQEIDLHSKVSGYLKSIHVDVGDFVRQGQLIAELEVPELAQDLAHARAALKRSELEVQRSRGEVQTAEIGFSIQRLSYERISSVVKSRPNLVAQQEIDLQSARYREAEARVLTAKAALAASEAHVRAASATKERISTMLAYLRVTAPFSGMITRRYGDPGAMIQAGTASQTQAMPVVRLSQVDRLRLALPVPESVVPRIRPGSPVEVRVDSLRRVFQGRISRFTGALNSSTRTMETEVDLHNPGYVLKPGMYGVASLKLNRRVDALAVPVQAVSGHDTVPTVLVVNGSHMLEERKVLLGLETPSLVEITSGLREGEQVVLGNRTRLKPGTLVEAKLVDTRELKSVH